VVVVVVWWWWKRFGVLADIGVGVSVVVIMTVVER